MSLGKLVIIGSFVIVAGTLLYTATADHRQPLPQQYYSLDKTKPWNDIARTFDLRMSDSEYDAMRRQYFEDRVAPYVAPPYSVSATWDEFKSKTERPWVWNRRASRGEPPFLLKVLFWLSTAYLIAASSIAIWRKVLRPSGTLLYEQGIAGFANAILHGRSGQAKKTSEQNGKIPQ